jgi:hypothetical protein
MEQEVLGEFLTEKQISAMFNGASRYVLRKVLLDKLRPAYSSATKRFYFAHEVKEAFDKLKREREL